MPALYDGNYNIAVGTDCLSQNNSGNNNIAIGRLAGTGVNGDENICIGSGTGITPKTPFSRSTCIGYQSAITASDQFTIGNPDTSVKVPGRLDVSGNLLVIGSLMLVHLPSVINHSLIYPEQRQIYRVK